MGKHIKREVKIVFIIVLLLLVGSGIYFGFFSNSKTALSNFRSDNKRLPALTEPDTLRIGFNFTSTSRNEDRDYDAEELVKKYIQAIEEMEDSELRYNYMNRLAEYYRESGDFDKAISLFKQILAEDSWRRPEVIRYLAKIYYECREFQSGLEILEGYQELYRNNDSNNMLLLEGDFYYQLGYCDTAILLYQKALERAKNEESGHFVYIKEEVDERMERINNVNSSSGHVNIKGNISVEGRPLAGIKVGVKADDGTWGSKDQKFIEITDENGNYQFDNLITGKYVVFIELELKKWEEYYTSILINGESNSGVEIDKEGEYEVDFRIFPVVKVAGPKRGIKLKDPVITFTWEDYPNAAYYKFGYGSIGRNDEGKIDSYSSRPVGNMLKENQITIDFTKLQKSNGGTSYSVRN